MIEPALPAGLATAAVESFGQVAPHHVLIQLALLVYVTQDDFVFLRRPVANRVGRGFLEVCFHQDISLFN